MLHEYVFVKEIKSSETKNGKKYPIVVAHNGDLWRLFNGEHVEINKAYVISYELSEDKQFKNIRQILPLQNVWLQQAIKEISTKTEIEKTVTVSTSYAKDLVVGGKIQLDELFLWAKQFYQYITSETTKEYDRINNSGINPKDIK